MMLFSGEEPVWLESQELHGHEVNKGEYMKGPAGHIRITVFLCRVKGNH